MPYWPARGCAMVDAVSALDRRFGDWVVQQFAPAAPAGDRDTLQRLAMAASLAVSLKHTCLDLAVCHALQEPLFDALLAGICPADVQRVVTPAVKPLVASADGQRVWLHKYHAFEAAVAQQLHALARAGRLEIITGGPGTGKTWQAAQRIRDELHNNPACVVRLAAPTGKAANNMMAALARANFDAAAYGLKGLTLHALLRLGGRHPQPRFHRRQPLAGDLLVIDEASMIDLPMMYRLLDALPPRATLLLLGDRDQLASVEAGSVLADICRVLGDTPCVRRLTESYRYRDSPEIGALATALNRGEVPAMDANRAVRAHGLPAGAAETAPWLAMATEGYGWIAAAVASRMPAAEILRQQTQFQLLCALREGPFGVTGINRRVAEALGHKPDSWYVGQPVIVTRNDHDRKLYNGDVGIVLEYEGSRQACFLVNGELKAIARAQMPAWETCYAITVHKSQGSEYDHVMIVLPADSAQAEANPVLTRELAYTAATRARQRLDLWAGEGVLAVAVARQALRMSGLQALLAQG